MAFSSGGTVGSFLGGASQAMEKNTELQAQYGYRNAELGMQSQKIALELAQFHRTTQKDLADRYEKDFDAMVGVGQKGMESGAFAANPGSREAHIQRLSSAALRAAGPLANLDPSKSGAEHYDALMNKAYDSLLASPDPHSIGLADGLKEYYKQQTGRELGTSKIAGENTGASKLAEAKGGGAAASYLDAAAQDAARSKVLPGAESSIAGSAPFPGGGGVVGPAGAVTTGAPPPSITPPIAPAGGPAASPVSPAGPGASGGSPPMGGGAAAQPGGRQITAVSPYNTFDVDTAKGIAKAYEDKPKQYMDEGSHGRLALHAIQLMNEALQSMDFKTGKFANVTAEMQAYAKGLGIDLGSPAGAQEFMKAAMSEAFQDVHENFGNRIAYREVEYAIKTNPSTLLDPAAVQRLIQHIAVPAQWAVARQDAWNAFAADPANRTKSGGPDVVKFEHTWNAQHPLARFEPGAEEAKPTPGSPEAGTKMIGTRKFIKDANSPSGWSEVQTGVQ